MELTLVSSACWESWCLAGDDVDSVWLCSSWLQCSCHQPWTPGLPLFSTCPSSLHHQATEYNCYTHTSLSRLSSWWCWSTSCQHNAFPHLVHCFTKPLGFLKSTDRYLSSSLITWLILLSSDCPTSVRCLAVTAAPSLVKISHSMRPEAMLNSFTLQTSSSPGSAASSPQVGAQRKSPGETIGRRPDLITSKSLRAVIP